MENVGLMELVLERWETLIVGILDSYGEPLIIDDERGSRPTEMYTSNLSDEEYHCKLVFSPLSVQLASIH